MALGIPLISVLGVVSAKCHGATLAACVAKAARANRSKRYSARAGEPAPINWWILGGSLLFVVFTLVVGLGGIPYGEEIVFTGSLAIVSFLIVRLTRVLESEARATWSVPRS